MRELISKFSLKLYFLMIFSSLNFLGAQKKDSIIFQTEDYNLIKNKIKVVSFEKLIKNPKKYHKKVITVFGYLSLIKGDSKHGLYIDRESYNTNNTENGLLYYQFHEDSDEILKKFNNDYAYVTGVFVNIENEKFKNAIVNIYRIENSRKIVYCR